MAKKRPDTILVHRLHAYHKWYMYIKHPCNIDPIEEVLKYAVSEKQRAIVGWLKQDNRISELLTSKTNEVKISNFNFIGGVAGGTVRVSGLRFKLPEKSTALNLGIVVDFAAIPQEVRNKLVSWCIEEHECQEAVALMTDVFDAINKSKCSVRDALLLTPFCTYLLGSAAQTKAQTIAKLPVGEKLKVAKQKALVRVRVRDKEFIPEGHEYILMEEKHPVMLKCYELLHIGSMLQESRGYYDIKTEPTVAFIDFA